MVQSCSRAVAQSNVAGQRSLQGNSCTTAHRNISREAPITNIAWHRSELLRFVVTRGEKLSRRRLHLACEQCGDLSSATDSTVIMYCNGRRAASARPIRAAVARVCAQGPWASVAGVPLPVAVLVAVRCARRVRPVLLPPLAPGGARSDFARVQPLRGLVGARFRLLCAPGGRSLRHPGPWPGMGCMRPRAGTGLPDGLQRQRTLLDRRYTESGDCSVIKTRF